MLLLLAAVVSAGPPKALATASVRIERSVSASEEGWRQLPKAQRREVIMRDEQGRTIVLRLVENQ